MGDFLNRIVDLTRRDIVARKLRCPMEQLQSQVRSGPKNNRSLIGAVHQPGMSVIAEVKRASPSRGDIRPDIDVASTVAAYERAGAKAVSVLTEKHFFKGSLADLETALSACGLPILRKDFVVDPYQVWEAAARGASAILLIAAALDPLELQNLYGEASRAGLECLVEVHNKDELAAALDAGASLVGINNRDLKTFRVSLKTTENLMGYIPATVAVVSESGIGGREDVQRLAAAGVDAVLVGEVLSASRDPEAKLKGLLGQAPAKIQTARTGAFLKKAADNTVKRPSQRNSGDASKKP